MKCVSDSYIRRVWRTYTVHMYCTYSTSVRRLHLRRKMQLQVRNVHYKVFIPTYSNPNNCMYFLTYQIYFQYSVFSCFWSCSYSYCTANLKKVPSCKIPNIPINVPHPHNLPQTPQPKVHLFANSSTNLPPTPMS